MATKISGCSVAGPDYCLNFTTNNNKYYCSSWRFALSGRITHFKSLVARAEVRIDTGESNGPDDPLLTEFMRYVNATKQSWPLEGRRPSALIPPHSVIKAQMDALMRNDWPEEDSGVRTAFQFSMPAKVEEILSGQVPETVSSARAWDAAERYLSFNEFSASLRDPLYAPLINCSSWQVASPVVFHGPRDTRALQCVRVSFETEKGITADRAYTFCLQKVQQGAYRNCWMVVGVRAGDYANI